MRQRGQIKPLGNGTFRIAVALPAGPRGERPYHHETLRNSTPAKAEKRLQAILVSVDDGSYSEPSRILLKDAIEKWLDRKRRKVDKGELKLSTLETYQAYIKKLDSLLNIELRYLTVSLLQDEIDKIHDSGLKASSLRLVYFPLKATLDLMVTQGNIKDNAARKIELPMKNKPKKAKVFDEKEVFRFMDAAMDDMKDFVFVLALITGMRPCEFIGLSYPHIWLSIEDGIERGMLQVSETVVRKRKGGWYLSTPKTKSGERPIPFPAFMYHAIMARKESHLLNLERLGKTHQLIFTNSKGEPLHRDILGRGPFQRLLDKAGIPREGHTLYTLRRSSATLSALLGEDRKVISEKMGHSSVEFTENEYIDVLPITQRMMADRLEKYLFRTHFADHGTDGVM